MQQRQKRQNRNFKSVCESRYKCELCQKVVWQLGGKKHKCGQQKQKDICYECGGPHDELQPCYIQPVSLDSLNVVYRREKPNDILNIPWNPNEESDSDHYNPEILHAPTTSGDDGDDHASTRRSFQRPYRYFIFDVECAQEVETSPGRFKHVPMLVCAEQICTRCIDAGIMIDSPNNLQRPQGCVCKGADNMKGEAAEWVVQGSDGRKLQFHNFDDTRINPLEQMLDFLTNHGPRSTTTYAISHNGTPTKIKDIDNIFLGGRYDIHCMLEALYLRRPQLKPKAIINGLKIYNLELRGPSGRKIIFKVLI